jgi:hypothetical protein
VSFCHHLASDRPLTFHILIFSSKTTEQNWTKLARNVADLKSNMAANENTLWTLAAMLDFKSAPKTHIW